MSQPYVADASMLDLFRLEAEEHSRVLTEGLLRLERNPGALDDLESCMRAAHSLKGAARIVDLSAGVSIAHSIENAFVAMQAGRLKLRPGHIDTLLHAVDRLRRIAQAPEMDLGKWHAEAPEVRSCVTALDSILESGHASGATELVADSPPRNVTPAGQLPAPTTRTDQSAPPSAPEHDRVLRVTADNLNRLLGLAGESLVASRRLKPFAGALLQLKRQQSQARQAVEELRTALAGETIGPQVQSALAVLEGRTADTHAGLDQWLAELDSFERRVGSLSRRMYDSAVSCRMRPFADGTHAFARMVRDLGRSLGKPVRLEIHGSQTPVDREVLEKLDAPLGHILRNAVDHGIEPLDQRCAAGKPEMGTIRLEARHTAGRLVVLVSDDGAGIDPHRLRAVLIERGLATQQIAAGLSDAELFAFLLLPGFTLASTVTEISGRGVGLDAVQDTLKQLRGTLRISSEPGVGTQFVMQLPLTLSIVRALIVDVGGEPYALPLASISRTVKVPKDQVTLLEGKPCFSLAGTWIGLVDMHQILGTPGSAMEDEEWSVVLVSMEGRTYALAVDELKGERELVVRPLDARLGKIRDIHAAALLEDGSPVLIMDVEDLVRSADKLSATDALGKWSDASRPSAPIRSKRVLIVEDSLTVRELERKLLLSGGYQVEVAVDGMDGWNAVRAGGFDLVLTDVDMPRMDGIELVTLIKQDPRLGGTPVMIVSYKDRPEDRDRGLRAGADYYLAKGSFHDQKLLSAVVDLIGEARA